MRRKHRPEEPLHYDRWLVSYADFITLLFAFFVVLYASSQVDKAKAAKLASSIQAAFRDVGVESTPEEISPLTELQVPPEASERSIDLGHFVQPVKSSTAADEETKSLSEAETQLKKVLSPEIEQHIVDIKSTREGVVVSLREVGFYESGSAKLRASSKAAVDRLAGVLQQRKEALRIEGHTDNVPIHTSLFDSNWELSTARAADFVKVLIQNYNLAPARLSAAGFAEYRPVAGNDTADGRAHNRRLDVVILNPFIFRSPESIVGNSLQPASTSRN